MKFSLWLALALAAIPGNLSAVSEAYPRTAPGDIELKTLPAARWMRTESAKASSFCPPAQACPATPSTKLATTEAVSKPWRTA